MHSYICNIILFSEFHQKIQASSLGCKIVAKKKLNIDIWLEKKHLLVRNDCLEDLNQPFSMVNS